MKLRAFSRVVPRHSLPFGEHHAEVELRLAMILFGGLEEPMGGLREVRRGALAGHALQPQSELCVGVALIGPGPG